MKRALIYMAILLIAAGCKKEYKPCGSCACINVGAGYKDTVIDSVTFYQAILGKWYVKQADTFPANDCVLQCFCDTQYFVTFLPNDTVIISLPDNYIGAFAYNFPIISDHLVITNGTYFLPDNPHFGYIEYSNGIIVVYPPTQTVGGNPYPVIYYLSRH
jgi:hypothetical protein